MTYYKSGETLTGKEIDKLRRNVFNLSQQIKYIKTPAYKKYKNITTSENGVSEESIFLIINPPPKISNYNFKCQPEVILIKANYGLSIRETKTTKGTLHTYANSSIRKKNEVVDESNAWPPPEHPLIEIVENLEDGIIFKVDNTQIVNDWVLYHKHTMSIPFMDQ
ncbi:MAG: hypothetical protein ACI9FN_002238 [Saprospiraceae bacterium]|jgi:hypothetical protein